MPTISKSKAFKYNKHKKEGKWRSFETDNTDIKLDKLLVGLISEASHLSNAPFNERYRISFMIVDPLEKSGFKWVKLKAKFSNELDCRDFCDKNFSKILETFDLYKMED